HSPAEVYPNTVVTYSYGKTLLTPGMLLGYIAIPPTMPDRDHMRERIFLTQIATVFAFPNADLQHAIGDLHNFPIDIDALRRRRAAYAWLRGRYRGCPGARARLCRMAAFAGRLAVCRGRLASITQAATPSHR